MYQRLMKGYFFSFFFFLNTPISGFGKLHLIIAKNFRTIFKVFSVSFDHDLMDSIQKRQCDSNDLHKLMFGLHLSLAFSHHHY